MYRKEDHRNRILICGLVVVLLLGLAACSDDDDPVTPVGEIPEPAAVSPDSLASLLTIAFESADAALLNELLDDNFRWGLAPRTVAYLELPSDYLNRTETMMAAGTLFAGENEPNNLLEADWDGIGSITVTSFVQVGDWETTDEYSVCPDAEAGRFQVRMNLVPAGGGSDLVCEELLTLYASSLVYADAEGNPVERWVLARADDSIIDTSKASIEELAITDVLCGHLEIGTPTGTLAVSDAGSYAAPLAVCQVTSARDDVHGLAYLPFRFAESDGEGWSTEWLPDAHYERDLETDGEHTVCAYVRNRWNRAVELSQAVTVERLRLTTATNREILMANFKTAYEGMYYGAVSDLLDPRFRMILMPETQDVWGWSADFDFDHANMVAIHTSMFRGEPGVDANGNAVHPIASVGVSLLEQMVGWAPIPEGDSDFGGLGGEYAPFRVTLQFHDANLTHRFLVQQQVNFYVVPVDEDGETVYRFVGLRGVMTGLKSDEVTWDAVLALYR